MNASASFRPLCIRRSFPRRACRLPSARPAGRPGNRGGSCVRLSPAALPARTMLRRLPSVFVFFTSPARRRSMPLRASRRCSLNASAKSPIRNPAGQMTIAVESSPLRWGDEDRQLSRATFSISSRREDHHAASKALVSDTAAITRQAACESAISKKTRRIREAASLLLR